MSVVGFIPVGPCLSGLLYKGEIRGNKVIHKFPAVVSRIAIVTPRALDAIADQRSAVLALANSLVRPPEDEMFNHGITLQHIMGRKESRWGMCLSHLIVDPEYYVQVFPNEQSRRVYQEMLVLEKRDYQKALAIIFSPNPGIGRTLFFALNNMPTLGLENLSTHDYMALLAILARKYRDEFLTNFYSIEILQTTDRIERVTGDQESGFHLAVSKGTLNRAAQGLAMPAMEEIFRSDQNN